MGNRYGLEIRAAAAGDAADLAALLSGAGHPVAAQDLAPRLAALQAAGGTALVAVEWGPPSGLAVLGPLPTLDAARPVAVLTALLVAPDARRRGIGRLLLKAASRAARQAGCERVLMPVEPGRADLAAFGAATGFSGDGRLLARPLLRRGPAQG